VGTPIGCEPRSAWQLYGHGSPEYAESRRNRLKCNKGRIRSQRRFKSQTCPQCCHDAPLSVLQEKRIITGKRNDGCGRKEALPLQVPSLWSNLAILMKIWQSFPHELTLAFESHQGLTVITNNFGGSTVALPWSWRRFHLPSLMIMTGSTRRS
jgi:hypothetical protein